MAKSLLARGQREAPPAEPRGKLRRVKLARRSAGGNLWPPRYGPQTLLSLLRSFSRAPGIILDTGGNPIPDVQGVANRDDLVKSFVPIMLTDAFIARAAAPVTPDILQLDRVDREENRRALWPINLKLVIYASSWKNNKNCL